MTEERKSMEDAIHHYIENMSEEEYREHRLDTCYHEAAHVVADILDGVPIDFVEITGVDGFVSATRYVFPHSAVEAAACRLIGNYAIHYRNYGECYPLNFYDFVAHVGKARNLGLEGYDQEVAYRHLQLAHQGAAEGITFKDLYHEAASMAENCVEEYRHHIDAIAVVLDEREFLSGADIEEIFGE
jgi:hypothetical protein